MVFHPCIFLTDAHSSQLSGTLHKDGMIRSSEVHTRHSRHTATADAPLYYDAPDYLNVIVVAVPSPMTESDGHNRTTFCC